jgi:hypothetical protein
MTEFPIVPPTSSPQVFFAIICVVMLAAMVFLTFLGVAMGREKFQVSSEGLKIAALAYGRTIPARDLDISHAEAMDLDANPDYQLVRRTFGTGMPGYQAGWFRMANGNKALVFLTDKQRVVRIPTRQDYTLLLSVDNPQEFVRVLKATIR